MVEALGGADWIAATIGAVAYFVLGAIWFGPLFGGAYDRGLGFQRSADQKWPLLYYTGPLVASIVVAAATAVLIEAVEVDSLGHAGALGLLLGVGFSWPVSVNNAINPKTPRPLLYGTVTGLYHVAGTVVVALIVWLMR